jgi:hypothetical protein
MVISHRRSLSHRVIGIWITQRKEKKKINVVRYDFEMIVKKTQHTLNVLNFTKFKTTYFNEFN